MEIEGINHHPSGRQEIDMEIVFKSRETTVFGEVFHQVKRTQESAECVVPDTEADIERIAAVQSSVFLKSKDLTGRGVLIAGEVSASVLYIREGGEALSVLRVRKPFSLEYETDEIAGDAMAQVKLLVQGTDVRVVNPRKISVVFELEGELSCYREETLRVDTRPEESVESALYVKTEERTLTLPNAVTEKSFALNEQFPFPAGQPVPERLVSERAEIRFSDCQLIGSKIILKGNAEIGICYLAADSAEPVQTVFTAPFSQIVEIGAESMAFCTLRPEITGAYFDLVDGINGEKLLDMELHAVVQLVCSGSFCVQFVTDAYSNRMPTELLTGMNSYLALTPPKQQIVEAKEQLTLAEDCREMLCVFPSPARITREQGQLGAAVNLDVVYRGAEGRLAAGRRTVSLTGETGTADTRLLGVRVEKLDLTPEDSGAACSLALAFTLCAAEKVQTHAVSGVILQEETPYAPERFPALTLVRAQGENLWELAKRYHSSVEKIRALNEEAESGGRMLLVPKCM